MDEVRIWSVDDDSNVVPLEPKGQMGSEWSFEDTLVKNPELLMPGLTLVGRQTLTEGGPLDLLGVDSDGRLVVFELKRGAVLRDAVAQIVDYASDLDDMELDKLADHISENSGQHGVKKIEDFKEWYDQEFEEKGLEALKPLRLFLVGLGADDRTERMVSFLAKNGMNISLLTFHGFLHGGTTLLAKQVRVEGAKDSGPQSGRRYLSAAEKKEKLGKRLEDYGVSELFDAVREMFRENWHSPKENSGPSAIGFSLLEQTASGRRARSYARIAPEQGSVRIVFYQRAKELCLDGFKQPADEIPHETWPRERNPLDPDTVIEFLLTAEKWDTHKKKLTALVQSIYTAWQNVDQVNGS